MTEIAKSQRNNTSNEKCFYFVSSGVLFANLPANLFQHPLATLNQLFAACKRHPE